MAVDDFKVGEGHYALAFGKHVVAGILAGYDDSVPTAVKIKVLLGLGEWNRIVEASYDGAIIDPANYTFHPGTLSTGKTDPLQGQDARFPNSIYHSRIAYYSMTLPDGMGADERPDKMRVIAEALKVPIYDETGVQIGYAYSTNPADAFAEVVRRNSLRLGLTFADQMDWPAYAEARERYSVTIGVDDGVRTPRNVFAVNSATGSLASGTWYYKVVATGAGTTKSAASEVSAVEAAASSKNTITWDAVTGATGYRIYYSFDDPNGFNNYFSVGAVTSYAHTTTTGASSGTPPTLPTGDWAKSEAEFQTHRAFTQNQILTGDALTAIMFDAASEWVRDGRKHRILLPNRSEVAHTFSLDNTTAEAFSFSKVPMRDRINRVTASYRNLDNNLKPEEASPANNFEWQARVGVKNEDISLGPINVSQMRRITRWRQKYYHGKPRRLRHTGQGDSGHLLVGDIVDVIDRQAGTRGEHGTLPNDGVILNSLMTPTTSDGLGWSDQPSPLGRSRAFGLTEGSAHFDITPFTPASGSVLLVYVKANELANEITIGVRSATTGTTHRVSLRRPQTTPMFGSNATRIGNPPPSGKWVPVRIRLDDTTWVAGESIDRIALDAAEGTDVLLSQIVYTERTPRRYIVDAIDDRDSDATDERLFSLHEYYEDAYDLNDAFIEPPPSEGGGGGEEPPPPPDPPALTGLSFSSPTVTGTFTVDTGATGTIRVYRKTGSGGTYAQVTTASYDDGSFTDDPGADGTYYYKLTQDGVTGESNESSITIALSTGSPPTDLAGYRDKEWYPDGPTILYLEWVNHGATGENVIQQKIGSGGWVEIARVALSETTYSSDWAPDIETHPTVRYRVYNTSTSGYSNELIT
jgi:hypothetical protein